MTFQTPDRFRFHGQSWSIYTIRGEQPCALSDEELGIQSDPYRSTALQRGRIDSWGVDGRQLVFLGAETVDSGANAHAPSAATCEFFLGRASGSAPFHFEDYGERLILGFARGLLNQVTVVEDAGASWAHVALAELQRTYPPHQPEVQLTLSRPMNILGSPVHAYEIGETFEIERRSSERLPGGTIEPLADFAHVRRLNLSYASDLHDVTPLARLSELRTLTLMQTPVQSVAPLSKLGRLEYLDISGTPVDDVAPLGACNALTYLDLRRTQVRSLRGLESIPRLETLLLGETPIEDLSPLHDVGSLRSLQLGEAQLDQRRLVEDLLALRATHDQLVFGLDLHPVHEPRAHLRVQTGFDRGERVFTPFADDERLIDERIPAFRGTDGEFHTSSLGAIQVRARGNYVFWIPPSTAPWQIQSFALARYGALAEEPKGPPPELHAKDLNELTSRFAAIGARRLQLVRGSGLLPREIQMQCSLARVFGDDLDQLSFVEPPPQFAEYRDALIGSILIGSHDGQLSIVAPGLPAWVTSPFLSEALFLPAPTLRWWPELLGDMTQGSRLARAWNQ